MKTTRWVFGIGVVVVASGMLYTAEKTYGKGVTLKAVTPLDWVLQNPSAFEGKTVRVEGVVTAVCHEMGCWMALGAKDAAGVPTLMVKVADGVIVFPVSAKGKKAAAQGVLVKVSASDKEGNEAAREKAAATDKNATSSSADTWMLKTTGAIVY